MNRIVPLVLLATCSLAQASPADSFRGVLERTAASPTRTVTFFEGLSQLEQGVVKGAPLRAALRESGVPTGGLLGAFLDGLERVEKRGSLITLQRAKEATVDTGSGLVWLGKTVKIRVEAAGPTHANLADLKGAQAGLNAMTLVPIRTLKLKVDAAQITTATLNVGYSLINKTIAIVLARPGPDLAAKGLASSVGD